jgi:hypothetical protein
MSRAGFFTVGVSPENYRLPHRRLGYPVILLIRRVLCRAFELLREQRFPLSSAQEDEVTAALRAVIENNLRQTGSIRGFDRRSYEAVVRQGEVSNYDGTRRAKTPDLCFKLRYEESEPCVALSEFDALFIECKPVDVTHSVGTRYCDDGLNRFVEGDYAWAMQEGAMLAYARNGRTIAEHLAPVMSESNRIKSLAIVDPPLEAVAHAVSPKDRAEAIHASHHRRSFPWPDKKGPACEITIYHLWHECN